MFNPLIDDINQENLVNLRDRHQEIGRAMGQYYGDGGEIEENEEFNERVVMFRSIMEENQVENRHRNRSNYVERGRVAQLQRQIQVLNEKSRIDKQHYERELEYLEEKYKVENMRLSEMLEQERLRQKTRQKQDKLIQQLRKQSRQLNQIIQQKQELIQQFFQEKVKEKKQLVTLRHQLNEKEEIIAQLRLQGRGEGDGEKRLKDELLRVEEERKYEVEKRKQVEGLIQKMRTDNDQLNRQVHRLKIEAEQQQEKQVAKSRSECRKLQEENNELRRRNQKLQQSFIEHLTQTSLNLQQTLKQPIERVSRNSSLYLNQTPIKHRSKGRERVVTVEEEDPEKGGQKCSCGDEMSKLKVKLKQANNKIVNLLQEKGKGFRS